MTDIPKDILVPKAGEVKLPERKHQEIIPKQEKKKVKRFKTENLIERIKTFELEENDILLIRFHEKVTQPIRQSIKRLIGDSVKEFKGHFILGIDSRMDLEAVPEIEFNKIGYYKKIVTWKDLLEIKRKKKLTLIHLASPLFMTPVLIGKNLSDPELENEPLSNDHLIELRKAKII